MRKPIVAPAKDRAIAPGNSRGKSNGFMEGDAFSSKPREEFDAQAHKVGDSGDRKLSDELRLCPERAKVVPEAEDEHTADRQQAGRPGLEDIVGLIK